MTQTPRHFTTPLAERLKTSSPFIQAVIGPRQVGKTTGVKALQSQLEPCTFLYHSADLPSAPRGDWILERWHEARSASNASFKTILVLDEIQKIPRWSDVVKGLYDNDRMRKDFRVVILGSASISMQEGLTESLLGRFELNRIPHWDLSECQQLFGWGLQEYLTYGGYPAAGFLASEPHRWQLFMQDSILEPVISRDILGLRSIAKTALLRQVVQLALTYPAQELSFNKMLGQLHDAGNTVTVKSYLEALEGAFLIKLLYKFSTRPLTLRSSTPKLLPLAPALLHAVTSPFKIKGDSDWYGRVFECAIGAHLLQVPLSNLFYWREGKDEVDFVLSREDQVIAIEVKSSKKQTPKSHRLSGLQKFKLQFPGSRTLILNDRSGLEFLQMPYYTDLWEFLLYSSMG